MLVEAIILSIICGFFLNRGKKDFDRVSVSGFILVLMAGVIEGASQFIISHDTFALGSLIRSYTLIIEILVYALLFLFMYMNRDKRAMKIIALGAFLNFIAIVSNNGYMMVDGQILLDMGFVNSYNELKEGLIFAHDLASLDSNFIYLADIINIPPPYPFPKSMSVGDLILDLGVFILVIDVFKESCLSPDKYFKA